MTGRFFHGKMVLSSLKNGFPRQPGMPSQYDRETRGQQFMFLLTMRGSGDLDVFVRRWLENPSWLEELP